VSPSVPIPIPHDPSATPARRRGLDLPGAASALIGRDGERAALSNLLDRLATGQGASRALVAAAGAGKTTLLDAFAADAAAIGATVVRAAGFEGEADLPWAALSSLCLPHRERFDRLPGPQGRALQTAFALIESEASIDRLAVSLGVLGVLSDLALSTPVVVVVDDLHWLDPESRNALGFLARRIGDDPIVLVTAGRPDGEVPPAEVLALPPLSDDAVNALLARSQVGSATARAAIAGLADGNPFLALQLADRLTDAERAGSRPVPATLRVPEEVEQLFLSRIDALPAITLAALTLAAADSSANGSSTARALEGVDRSMADLEQAEAVGLVAVEGTQVRFVHPLARSAVYHRASAPARRRAHLMLAEAEDSSSPRGVLHRAAAATGIDSRLAEELAVLASDARQRGAPLVAAERCAQAATLAGVGSRRVDLLVAGARAALAAGEARWAADLMANAEAESDGGHRLETHRVRVRLAAAAGHVDEARRLAEEAADAFAASDPVGVAEVLSEAVRPLLPVSPLVAARLCERIWELAGGACAPASLYAEILYGCGRFLQGDAEGAARHVARWSDLLDEEGAVEAGPFLAETAVLYFVVSNQIDRAAAMLDRIEGPVRARCASSALVSVLTARGFLDYGRDLQACVAASREAIEVADAAGLAGLAPVALQVVVVAAGTVGDDIATELVAGRLLANGELVDQAFARAGLARLHLVAGRFEAAADQFDRLRATLGPTNGTTCSFEGDEVEALVRVGRIDDARAVLPALAEESTMGAWRLGQYERSLALVADDLDEAVSHFAAARRAVAETDNRIAQGLVELLWGERLRRAKRRAEARRHLELAGELFDRVGAVGLRRRAHAELAAAGGASDRSLPPSELLSSVELQVARLAVGGATNRDIANQLFISPRTVENHLGAVYRKLGVSGRPLLLARAADDPSLRAVNGVGRSPLD
jgi:DNA-binding CsgD family transcriptional regulator